VRPSLEKDPWIRWLAYLAAGKVAIATLGYFVGQRAGGPRATDVEATALPPWVLVCGMVIIAAGGGFLLLAGRKDTRASYLGMFFLLLATAFANRPLSNIIDSGSPFQAHLVLVLRNLPADGFAPYFFWLFTREFPNGLFSTRAERLVRFGIRVSLLFGLVFLAYQLGSLGLSLYQGMLAALPLPLLAPKKPSYPFYTPFAVLMVASFAVLAWRARRVSGEERRRVQLFVWGLVAGLAPLFLQIVYDIATGYGENQGGAGRRTWLTLLMFLVFVSAPLSSAYAVVFHHVLNAQLVARRALQYALARYSAIGLAAAPMVALLAYLYTHRQERVADIFSGSRVPLLIAASFLGLTALRFRKRLLDAVDRRFFREQYDARQILTLLGERIRATRDVASLASLITKEIDLALHLEGLVLMVLELRSGMLVDPKNRSRRLDSQSMLAMLIANASDPIVVDLELPGSSLARLPAKDRHWLVDSGFRLIVPILARDGSLLGLIGLGEKRSGLPFLREDRQLLRAIANSSSWVLELEQGRGAPPPALRRPLSSGAFDDPTPEEMPHFPAEQAKECPICGILYPSYTVLCTHCSRRLEVAHIPYVLPGKFRFERRIGAGGMGLVYRGADLALGRPVAVKTMRRISPEDALRLRREARTAAVVSHTYLASIYGIETWQGTPMLIMELLEGGTLAQRIEQSKLTPAETVDLGISMAEALGQLHRADILHRDIKPSNIGYTRDGRPKLMDFGIARLMLDLNGELDTASDDPRLSTVDALGSGLHWARTPDSSSATRQLVGTLAYLSPEAVSGHREDTSFDLWSLAIVLYECLLGRKIFSGSEARQIMARIRNGRVPDFSQVCPEHDEALGEFFRGALHRNLSLRPANADEFKDRLQKAKARLSAI
jgi:uncharacterized membrane protein YphA (DoxX/SURF4 family)